MTFDDSRRLTGPNRHTPGPAVVLEATVGEADRERIVAAWERHARRLLGALGWSDERTFVRRHATGASLGFTAPEDALYAATEVNEAAWAAAAADLGGETSPEHAATVERLRAAIAAERNPALRALHAAADRHGVAFFFNDDAATVGLGAGSRTWDVHHLPAPDEVDWSAVHDVPVALVTGTNGKSTTVRLVAAMAAASGRTAGLSSTDFVRVGDEIVDRGDYSGPGGARRVLRDRRVEVAVLETARGGLLRRGLALDRAAVALVTNVAEDHMGEYGIHALDDLIEAKLIVRQAVERGGLLLLNADDAGLVRHAARFSGRLAWFGLDPDAPALAGHRAAGGRTYTVEDGAFVAIRGHRRTEVLPVDEAPITLGGAARHGVANALAAIGLAEALGLPMEGIRGGLRAFRSDPVDNPGRGNYFDIAGARVLVDFAHNEHGIAAIADTVRALPAERRLVMLGHAGDRTDAEIRALARAAWSVAPEHVIITELPEHLRGRAPGEVSALINDEIRRLGAGPEHVTYAPDPATGARLALDWMRPGDLLLLFVLSRRSEVLAMLHEARAHSAG